VPQLSARPLGGYGRTMKTKILMLSIIFSSFLFSQNRESQLIGNWVCTELDSFPSYHRIVDVWRLHYNFYEDTVYHFYPEGKSMISGISKGLWYVKGDTMFVMDTLILDSHGKRIVYDNPTYDGRQIVRIDSSVMIIEEPVGIMKYLRQP
jgi:hypothetical protein